MRYTCIYLVHILPVCAVWGESAEVNINQPRMPCGSPASLELQLRDIATPQPIHLMKSSYGILKLPNRILIWYVSTKLFQ